MTEASESGFVAPHADVRAVVDELDRLKTGLEALGLKAPAIEAAMDMLTRQSAEIARHRSARDAAQAALEPFARFGGEWVDGSGWTCNIHRESISTWFGPTDFQNAKNAADQIDL